MSIRVVPALVEVDAGSVLYGVLLGVSAVALLAAWFIGMGRPGGAPRTQRIPQHASAWPMAAVFFGAAGCYLFAGAAVAAVWDHLHPGAKPGTILESDRGAALFSTIPALAGLVAILLGDAAVADSVGQNLGLRRRQLPGGLLVGLLGAVIIVPPLFFLSALVERIYQRVQFHHPTEHPLLRALGERPSQLVQWTIVIGACIIAPLWEEILFRGHIETLLKRMFGSLAGRAGDRSVLADWLAIVVTSCLFMVMHPMWSWPVIFVLAICLGYVYERTNNLWASIMLHAAFNTASTMLFLAGAGSR